MNFVFFHCYFLSFVFPGQTLRKYMWSHVILVLSIKSYGEARGCQITCFFSIRPSCLIHDWLHTVKLNTHNVFKCV